MKKIITIISILIILFVFVACNNKLNENEKAKVDNTITYLSIGDSITAGYLLPEYIRDGQKVNGSFACKINKDITANTWFDLGVTGATTLETLEYVENYNSKGYFPNTSVVTLSIGSNDIMGPGLDMVYEKCGVNGSDELFDKITKLQDNNDYATIAALALKVSNYIKSKEADEIFMNAVQEWKGYFIRLIDKIYEYSPNAKIYIVNYYNPFVDVNFGNVINVGDVIAKYLDLMNEYISTHIYNNRRYYIANVSDIKSDKTNVNVDLENGIIEVDPHPNLLGHEYIYTKLIELINKYNDKKAQVVIGDETSFYTSISDAWYKVNTTLDSDIKMILLSDWYSDIKYNFGSGEGYKNGAISPTSRANGNILLEIDLNGHRIDRCLYTPIDNGEVLNISFIGNIVLNDGTVTGGNNKGNGGGLIIEDNGSNIILNNLRIVNNKTQKKGGGIYYLKKNIKLDIKNAIIENNECGEYGAVVYTDNK